ncbi:MAG: helix-turn-helix domain-containing protein [Bacteroidales bacterium]|jgi:AraC-like DNA-binding protein|nr:helix-turn-helix domain-containing protein [Bacteroidales bacterium]
MNASTQIDILSVVIFFGSVLGSVLSCFFIMKPSANREANRFQGLLILSMSLIMLEQVLNLTGYIVSVIHLTFSTAVLNFLIGPFLYLFVRRSLGQQNGRREWIHFVLPLVYLTYLVFSFVQPEEFKYNIYVRNFRPEWPLLEFTQEINSDPLGINRNINVLTAVQVLFYIGLSFFRVMRRADASGTPLLRLNDEVLRSLRDVIFHILVIILIFIIVKLTFRGSYGDYFITVYISLFIFYSTIRIINDSSYFERHASILDVTPEKYRKSTLSEEMKIRILNGVNTELSANRYFSNNLASLSELARRIGESPHNVSQVINEKLNQSFFELLASYRVEEARKILSDKRNSNLTIEEVSEMVGYNSKTAFNNAFRKNSGTTPSEFRKSSYIS